MKFHSHWYSSLACSHDNLKPRTLEIYKFLGLLPDVLKESFSFSNPFLYHTAPDDGSPPKSIHPKVPAASSPDRPLVFISFIHPSPLYNHAVSNML